MAQTTHLKAYKSIPLFLSAVGGTVLLGMLAGVFSGSHAGYSLLVLPPATPPDVVFPVVWSILYVMIGMSLFFILRKPAVTEQLAHDRRTAATLWFVQFGMNILWPFAFFALKMYAFSLIWLAALVAVTTACMIYAFRTSPAAGVLLIPYQGWLLFALYLNLFIAILN